MSTRPRIGSEALEVTEVTRATLSRPGPSVQHTSRPGPSVQYTSRYPAWRASADIRQEILSQATDSQVGNKHPDVFGGLVYAQASLAAARCIETEEQRSRRRGKAKMGIHSMQGVFTLAGFADRPFVHEVTRLHTGNNFATRLVQTRQPTEPSVPDTGPFAPSDAEKSLSDVCFSCLTTFKRSRSSPDEVQEAASVQQRFSDILTSRPPEEWEPSPLVNIDEVHDKAPNLGHGTFPILDMYRVDMTGYNKDKAVPERRELILYRPVKPIPRDDVNCHIVTHALGADRNGITMLGSHLGYGYRWGRAASLSYSFYVHVNAESAVMDGDGWWIQETSWSRVSAGRCMMMSKIWSPDGRHVATSYQDGLLVPREMERL